MLRIPPLSRPFLALTALVALFASSDALALNDTTCSLAGTTLADAITNSSTGEDDAFLGSKSKGLPYIAFVLDSSAHMRKLPIDVMDDDVRASGLGCANSLLNNLSYDVNFCVDAKGLLISPLPANCNSATGRPTRYGLRYQQDALGNPSGYTYDPIDPDFTTLFLSARYYVLDRGWGANGTTVSSSWVFNDSTAACGNGLPSGELAACKTCVEGKGYYLPATKSNPPVLSGNWLNFFPPKYVVARKALKDVFNALDSPARNRLSIMNTADSDSLKCYSLNKGNTGIDGARDGAKYLANPTQFKPPCSQFNACTHNGSSGGGRAAFMNAVNNNSTLFTSPVGVSSICPAVVQLPSTAPTTSVAVLATLNGDNVCSYDYVSTPANQHFETDGMTNTPASDATYNFALPAATGGTAVNMNHNSCLSMAVTLPATAKYAFTVRAEALLNDVGGLGGASPGYPIMELRIDGNATVASNALGGGAFDGSNKPGTAADGAVTSWNVNSTTLSSYLYTTTTDLTPGSHTLSICYTNDYNSGSGLDRDLLVDYLDVIPVAVVLAPAICAPYAESLLSAGQALAEANLYDTKFAGVAGKWLNGAVDSGNVCDAASCGCPKPTIILIAGGEPDFDDNLPDEITSISAGSCGAVGAGGKLAKTAKYLATELKIKQASFGSKATVSTFVIGFGTNNSSLVAAAEQGNGQFFQADSAQSLKSSINQALKAVGGVSLSFSNANVSAVQTRTSSNILVPRFTPTRKSFWEGHLFQYKLVSEDACGCFTTTAPDPYSPCDFNQDRVCGGVFFKDSASDWIAADSKGIFRKATLNAATKAFETTLTDLEAVPNWDAATALDSKSSATGVASSRKIFTVLDANNDGLLDYNDNVVAFDESNADALLPYLSIAGSDFCQRLSVRLGTCLTPTLCAKKVIQYVRGMDIFDENCNGSTTDDRANKLGDIFHSSPVLVDPPLGSRNQLCRLGLHNQCVVSIYATPTVKEPSTSYDDYVNSNLNRDKLVLVGANDGMLHAFAAGGWHGADNPETTTINECPTVLNCPGYYDGGTGVERWAFIPPDILPKLRTMVLDGHQYYVDGSAMVRDIWSDANSDLKKEANEFHTIAVVGERRGGNHFFALDITNPAGPTANTAGFFRWLWPQPNTLDARQAGESYSDYLPSPPPIGPVRVKTALGGAPSYQGVPYEERWVAMLNGGFDRNGMRGRDVSMIDVWYGGAGASTPSTPLFQFTGEYSFAATPAMVGFGPNTVNLSQNLNDYFFDTATMGDTGGQLWAVRFNNPDPTKWSAGKIFASASNTCARQPFYQITSNTISRNGGHLRTAIGTGDRFNLADKNGGVCGLDNLLACVRRGCKLQQQLQVDICDTQTDYQTTYNGTNTATACTASERSRTSGGAPQNNCCSKATEVEVQYELDCTGAAIGPATGNIKWQSEIVCKPRTVTTCGTSVTDIICKLKENTPFDICSSFPGCDSALAGTPANGFYAMKVFDDAILARNVFDTPAGATTFSGASLDLTSLVQVNPYDLTSTTAATASQAGWYVSYGLPSPPGHVFPGGITADAQNERTATQATLVGGCAFWSTYTPPSAFGTCGSGNSNGVSTQYHLGLISGNSCAGLDPTLGTYRIAQTVDATPPAAPQITVFVSPSGTVTPTITGVPRGPGGSASTSKIATGDEFISQVYELDVTRGGHACRHPPGATPAAQQAAARVNCSAR